MMAEKKNNQPYRLEDSIIGASVTVVVADDVDDFIQDEDAVDEEDVDKSIVELFAERKFSSVKKRLQTRNVTEDELTTLDDVHLPIPSSSLPPLTPISNFEIVSLILEYTNYKCIPKYAGKPLNLAAQRASNIFHLLLKTLGSSADLNYSTPDSPLFMAVQSWNSRGIELLLLANASVHHTSKSGRTPLHVAAASGYDEGVKLLLMAGAEIDVKDNDGKYPIQETDNDYIRSILRTERVTRVKYPAHIMARNGDISALNAWLSETTAKGPGVAHVWNGQYLRDSEWRDLQLKVKLVRDKDSHLYKCMGQYEDTDGVFYISGTWVAANGRLDILKTYADDGYTIAYGGDVDDATGTWTGQWTAGDLTGELKFNLPLHDCVVCGASAKVPNAQQKCFGCEATEAQYFTVEAEDDSSNNDWNMSVYLAFTPDVEANVYRVDCAGYDTESYVVSGAWKDGCLNFAKHYAKSTVNYDVYYNDSTKKCIGTMVDGDGVSKSISFAMDMSPCTECGADVPVANSKCFSCAKASLNNWTGQCRLVYVHQDVIDPVQAGADRGDDDAEEEGEEGGGVNDVAEVIEGDDLNDQVWRDLGFHMLVQRDASQQCYHLIGEGKDNDTGETFDAVGKWQANVIQVTKIYADGVSEFNGVFASDTNEWTGTCTLANGNKEAFRVRVPLFSCVLCDGRIVPNVNDVCLACTSPTSLSLPWNPQNGKLVHAWVGRCRQERGEWEGDEFSVKVLRDVAMQVYRFTGFDKDGAGYFAVSGTWKDDDIHMERIYMDATSAQHGKFDAMKSEWTGTDVTTDNDGGITTSRFQYKIPMWPCTTCATAAVPIQNSVCFACDQPRHTMWVPLELPFQVDAIRRDLSARQEVSNQLNVKDRQGRTALMHAAEFGRFNILQEILLYVNPADIRINDNAGKSALDIALSRKLTCANNMHHRTNDEILTCVELLRRRSCLQLKPTTIVRTHVFFHNSNDKGVSLFELAKAKSWDELEAQLDSTVAGDRLNAKDADSGSTVAHVVCREGKQKILKMLLDQPELDLDIFNNSDDYQLTLLNPKSRCYKYIVDKFTLMQRETLNAYYRANVPSVRVAEKHQQAKQTALHAAVLHGQPPHIVELLAQDDLIDVDAKDKNGDTAMMLAARGKDEYAETYISILIAREADYDATNSVQIINKYDVMVGSSKSKAATPHGKIKDLLNVEMQARESSVEFRDKLAKSLMGMTAEEAFLQGGFRKAINCSPALARTFLDDSVVINRHDVVFSQMEEIYGDECNDTSTLNALLNLKSDDPEYVLAARKECLEHIVTRRLLQIKWELFGLRKYMEQLMMNVLLLVTSTVSSIVFEHEAISQGPLVIGVTAVVLTIVMFVCVQLLRPQMLWRLGRYFHDGSLQFDPKLAIPDLGDKKRVARRLLFQAVVLLTGALVVPILLGMEWLGLEKYFAHFNNIVLWLTVSFFLITELQEVRAVGALKYFDSNINKAQMAIYLVLFFVFVPMKLGFFAVDPTVQIGIGSFITILLWVLTVQFLEVVPSASYLLPMMSNLLQDVWNFFILFGVFQMGLTITFYQLFKHQDDDAFATITQSFITTYFVTFGELPLDSVKAFNQTDDGDRFLSSCAVVLMMFHAAVVVILLLNVLLAMMNKTVDNGFERAKTEALASYAQCILRLEESMNLSKAETVELIHFKTEGGDLVLNPIFNERVAKSSIKVPDGQEAHIDAYQKQKMAWVDLMDALKASTTSELDSLRSGLHHVQHFVMFDVATALAPEFALLDKVQDQVNELIDLAKKTRGQDADNALKKLDALVKKTLSTFEDNMQRAWNAKDQTVDHTKCTLLHQMTYKVTISDLLKSTKTTIQATFEHEIDQAKARAAPEPRLSEIVDRFDKVDATLKERNEDNTTEMNQDLAKKIEDVTQQTQTMASKLDDVAEHNQGMATQVEAMNQKLEALMAAILDLKR
ncbi:hypothetical protein DYB37_000454 [Aphanomyces astaci]|uniref:Ion transport domain-containing protein n=1 Tax=Aphanomyces astaci TaxID=112090 RepID=A0A3R6XR60_APHAT|nr:hypothetical protein DYB37_000454 [Aphanomyces astaci]